MLLPAVGDTPDGVARWRVTADGDTRTVQSRAMWVGAAETTPQTAYPLDRPVRTVLVSLAGHEDLAAELRVVDQADPVLFFSEDGRRLAGTVSLPRSQVWIMHPADRELEFTGQAGQIVEPAVPFGWDGWRLRLVSLENVQAVGLRGGRPHPVEVQARPRLLLGDPLPGVATPFGSPVYPVPPRLSLPQHRVRTSAGTPRSGARAAARRSSAASSTRPARSTSGKACRARSSARSRSPSAARSAAGCASTIFVAEGLSVAYQPQVRLLTRVGLAEGTARLTAAAGATAQPATLRFGPAERAHPSSTGPPPSPSRWSSPRRTWPSCARALASRPGRPPWCTW